MGTFVTDPNTDGTDIFPDGDKRSAPNLRRPSDWTSDNTTQASEMNAIRDALLDLRTEARGNVFSVKHYGALGDGSTNDTAAVQAAVTAAAAERGVVLFPRSDEPYLFADVTLDSGVTVECAQGARFGVVAGLSEGTHYWFKAIGTAESRKSQVSVVGAYGDADETYTGMLLAQYADDVVIERCEVVSPAAEALNQGSLVGFENCRRPTVRDCRSEGGYYGVNCLATTDALVEGGSFRNVQRDGVLFYDHSDGARAVGVHVDGFCLNSDPGRAGIHFYGGESGAAVGCVVRNSTGQAHGIRARDFDNFAFVGNTVDDCYYGLGTNQIDDYAGITVRGTISGNSVRNSGDNSIHIGVGSGPVAVTGNAIFDATGHGILVAAADATVVGNVLRETTGVGISVSDGDGGVRVIGNTLSRCSKGGGVGSAIFVSIAAGGVVDANHIYDDQGVPTTTYGIRILSGASAVVGSHNTFGAGVGTKLHIQGTLLRESGPYFNPFGGVPGSGTFQTGQLSIDSNGRLYRCATAGTPGTWHTVQGGFTATATLDFPSIAAQSQQELTITVTGAVVGDAVLLGPPASITSGLVASGRVSATDTVTVRLANVTSGAIDPASATWRATVLRA